VRSGNRHTVVVCFCHLAVTAFSSG
jgi:hypothetical protein